MEKKTYAMFGIAGFVAKRHVEAIKNTGGKLIAGMDPHENIGFIDSYFPDCEFFTQEEEFQNFCREQKPDYVVVCTPNHLHKKHSVFGLSLGSCVICEKPVAIYPKDFEYLVDAELTYSSKIYTILQLRLNPVLQGLKCELENSGEYYKADLRYISPRGRWYAKTWKGDEEKSGNIQLNIGVHLFDLVLQLFGSVQHIKLKTKTNSEVSGELYLQRGHITFNLGIVGTKQERILSINKREIEFSKGFTQLHDLSYRKILSGEGFGLAEALPSIILCNRIRNMDVD